MPLEGHQSIHTRPMVLRTPVNSLPSHSPPQDTDTQDTTDPEADDQDLETATFLGSIWNLFKDTKELSQELLKDTKELASRELDTLLDRLPFGQAKSNESEDTDASSDHSTPSFSQQRQPPKSQSHRRQQPLRKHLTSQRNRTHISNPLDVPDLPPKKSGKLSRESSVSRIRDPSLIGEQKDLKVNNPLRETLETSSSTHVTPAEDILSFTNTATDANSQLDYSLKRPSGALYLSSQELPPSPTLRIQRNISLRNLQRSDKPPAKDSHHQESSIGLKSTSISALEETCSPTLPILSTVSLTPPPPSSPSLLPSPPSVPSEEAEDKLTAVLKELADVKQQVQGFLAFKEQVGQIEALRDQVRISP